MWPFSFREVIYERFTEKEQGFPEGVCQWKVESKQIFSHVCS